MRDIWEEAQWIKKNEENYKTYSTKLKIPSSATPDQLIKRALREEEERNNEMMAEEAERQRRNSMQKRKKLNQRERRRNRRI